MDAMDPGPFAPLVGYVGAILAAVYSIGLMWKGLEQDWVSPEENMPGRASRIVLVITAVGVIYLWLYARPETLGTVMSIAIWCLIVTVISFLASTFLRGTFLFEREVAISDSETVRQPIVGGFWLRQQARTARKATGLDAQTILENAAYRVDAVWSRPSRELAKLTFLICFLLTMAGGTLALAAGGLAIQIRLTGEPASSVILAEDAPAVPGGEGGLDDGK